MRRIARAYEFSRPSGFSFFIRTYELNTLIVSNVSRNASLRARRDPNSFDVRTVELFHSYGKRD